MPLKFGPLSNAAHLCVDMQRMFVEPSPWLAPWAEKVLPVIVAVSEYAPQRTVFTRFVPLRAADAAPGTWRRYYERWPDMTLDKLPPGFVELTPALARLAPPALVLDKRVFSPWHDGVLAGELVRRGVTTLIVSGLETEVCVLATVLGAIDHGFRVVIAADAICSSADETHDAMRRIYESRFGMQVEVAQAQEILAAWPVE